MTATVTVTAEEVDRYVGEQVRKFRKQRGMSQPGLAACVGMSPVWLTFIEAGVRGLRAVRLVAVATALGVQPGELLPVVVPPQGGGDMGYADDCAKVYSPTGRVAHLRPPNYSVTGAQPVLCPQSLPWGGWLGTGTQAEYERAASLPACKPCMRVAARLDAEKRL